MIIITFNLFWRDDKVCGTSQCLLNVTRRSHKTGQSDETCHFGGGAALFSIALVAASQRSTNGSQLVRRSLPELEGTTVCGGKGLLRALEELNLKLTWFSSMMF
ncbi:hypothetical protein FPOAC2_02719 [Fusarium poae]